MTRIEKALEYFTKMSCSSAVLSAYADKLGISEEQALITGKPMAGGRMGKCGAVLAAEEVLKSTRPDKVAKFETRFTDKNGSIMCAELKGKDTGVVLRPCKGCVEDACVILEDLLREQ